VTIPSGDLEDVLGVDVMIFLIFSPKNWRFLVETKLNYDKFDQKTVFFDENCRKSQTIVNITSTSVGRFYKTGINFVVYLGYS
jgi:hypothetical protein